LVYMLAIAKKQKRGQAKRKTETNVLRMSGLKKHDRGKVGTSKGRGGTEVGGQNTGTTVLSRNSIPKTQKGKSTHVFKAISDTTKKEGVAILKGIRWLKGVGKKTKT